MIGFGGAAEIQVVDARQRVAVHLDVRRAHGQAQQRPAHGQHRGLEDVDVVDLVAIGPADGPGDGALADFRSEDVALFGSELLRVGEAADRPVGIEDDGRRHDGARERSAARLVDAGDAHAIVLRGDDA